MTSAFNDGKNIPAGPPIDPKLMRTFVYCARILRSALHEAVQGMRLPGGARVLDYGCSSMQYRNLFPDGADYVGADLSENPAAHVHLDAEGKVPLASSSFDVVVSTQVLEHVTDPAIYLAECRRLVKPGGTMMLSTHGVYVYHPCPTDYWRWTEPGLRMIVEKAGFEISSVTGLVGGAAASLQFFQDTLRSKLPAWLQPAFCKIIQWSVAGLDAMYTPRGRLANPWVYLVLAKPR